MILFNRSQNVPINLWGKKKIYVCRGLYPLEVFKRKKLSTSKVKFGMFSFTRKPFAIPDKKGSKKR